MPRVPLTWLAEYVELPAGAATSRELAEQVAADLARVGLEEEGVESAGVTGPLVVGQVLQMTGEPQKNGKTIEWCQVDVGPVHAGPDGGPRGIVCGAHNLRVGDKVVVALPGAVLPGDFAIAARKTYGHISDGMICSQRELGLGDDHDGIIVLSRLGLDPEPGANAAELLGLTEQTLEINVTPDRGYCFSIRGVAREYAHATGAAFRDPAAVPDAGSRPVQGAAGGFAVELADTSPIHGVAGCDRFGARIVRGVAAARPSPAWMQRRLTQAGMRPLGIGVDVTNYVMLELGQPMHAYTLDTMTAPITVRRARAGETMVTLDGVERLLDVEDLLITDAGEGAPASRIVGLAGVMGGQETEVAGETADLLLEAAHFDPVSIARTARRHKLPSEASRRFERGVDPALGPVAIQRAVDLLVEFGGGVADEALTDEMLPGALDMPLIALDPDLPARVVGVGYTHDRVAELLVALGCAIDRSNIEWQVTPPTWRPDLRQAIDLVEEVARIDGYDKIDSVLPVAPAGNGLSDAQRSRRLVSRALAEQGFVEVTSYPFVGAEVFDSLGLAPDDARRVAARLANPLSEEAGLLRTEVLQTLVGAAKRNISRGFADLAIFEVGLVSLPTNANAVAPVPAVAGRPTLAELAAVDAAVPSQPRHIAGLLTGAREVPGVFAAGRQADWTDALAAARLVCDRLGIGCETVAAVHAPWHPGRCAQLRSLDGKVLGWAGELHPKVCERLELPARTVAFELDLDAAIALRGGVRRAEPISPFPLAKEDLAFVVDASLDAQSLVDAVRRGAGEVLEDVRVFDVYTGSQIGEGKKSVAVALRLRAADRTLTADDLAAARSGAIAEAESACAARLRQ